MGHVANTENANILSEKENSTASWLEKERKFANRNSSKNNNNDNNNNNNDTNNPCLTHVGIGATNIGSGKGYGKYAKRKLILV